MAAELTARIYGEGLGDYQLVSSWWRARHGSDLAETVLPPLGVIIEHDGQPLGAMWCYECFGVGVCFLEYPMTRPGLSLTEASSVMMMAVEACIAVAKQHGDYSLFRAFPDDGALSVVMERCGFQKADHTTKRIHMAIRRD